MSSWGRKGGKRSKSVLNLRVTIIYSLPYTNKGKILLEILAMEPGTTSYKPKTIALSHGGLMQRQFLEFYGETIRV